jgi:hypothetical protein
MQIDDLMSTDAEDNVLYIAGNPIKPDRMYRVAINRQVMTGMDTIVPIIGTTIFLYSDHKTIIFHSACLFANIGMTELYRKTL